MRQNNSAAYNLDVMQYNIGRYCMPCNNNWEQIRTCLRQRIYRPHGRAIWWPFMCLLRYHMQTIFNCWSQLRWRYVHCSSILPLRKGKRIKTCEYIAAYFITVYLMQQNWPRYMNYWEHSIEITFKVCKQSPCWCRSCCNEKPDGIHITITQRFLLFIRYLFGP